MASDLCPLPTKADDANYKRMIADFERLGPNDPAFKAAIQKLMRTSPTQATKALSVCQMKGGAVEEGETSVAPSVATEPASKTKCYMIAMSQITAGLVGVGGGLINYILPYLASIGSNPCDGMTDQLIGGIASLWDESMSCAAREAAVYNRMVAIGTGLTGLLGAGFRKTLMKSPGLFKLLLKYLAARQCPELFNNYSFADFQRDVDAVYAGVKLTDIVKQEPAASRAASSNTAVAAASDVRGQEEEYVENPEEAVGSRTRRGRRGGKSRKSHKKRNGKLTRRVRKSHKQKRGKTARRHKRSASRVHHRR
jgi:hypothetical protein